MQNSNSLQDVVKNFQEEVKQLEAIGIKNWASLRKLKDKDLLVLVQKSRATTRNLKFLRGMASFICQVNLSHSEAALLLHAGIASPKALSSLTPSELIQKAGRLERQLNLGRKPYIDMEIAKKWVQRAKRANSELTQ